MVAGLLPSTDPTAPIKVPFDNVYEGFAELGAPTGVDYRIHQRIDPTEPAHDVHEPLERRLTAAKDMADEDLPPKHTRAQVADEEGTPAQQEHAHHDAQRLGGLLFACHLQRQEVESLPLLYLLIELEQHGQRVRRPLADVLPVSLIAILVHSAAITIGTGPMRSVAATRRLAGQRLHLGLTSAPTSGRWGTVTALARKLWLIVHDQVQIVGYRYGGQVVGYILIGTAAPDSATRLLI